MKCLHCGGEMVRHRDEIATQRGTLVDEWLACEDCGAEDGDPPAVWKAAEEEAEEAQWHRV